MDQLLFTPLTIFHPTICSLFIFRELLIKQESFWDKKHFNGKKNCKLCLLYIFLTNQVTGSVRLTLGVNVYYCVYRWSHISGPESSGSEQSVTDEGRPPFVLFSSNMAPVVWRQVNRKLSSLWTKTSWLPNKLELLALTPPTAGR